MNVDGIRRRIIIVTSAVLTLVAADVAVRAMMPTLRAYRFNEYERKLAAVPRSPAPEIVLLGSSRAKYALAPDQFEAATGRRAYNLGIAGSKIVEWIALSRRLFEDWKPQLVVIGINASELRADYVPSEAARNLFTADEFLDSCRHDGVSRDVVAAYLHQISGPAWSLFDSRYELRMWGQEQIAALLPKHAQLARELRERVARPDPPDGYEHPWAQGRQLRSVEERLLENVANVEAASVPMFTEDAPGFDRLAELMHCLRSRHMPVIVAYLPNCPRTEERWHNVEPKFIARIASVCQSCGVTFIECTPAQVPRTNHDFIEEVHVGLPLARRISSRIARQAVAIGLLQPREQLAQHPEKE